MFGIEALRTDGNTIDAAFDKHARFLFVDGFGIRFDSPFDRHIAWETPHLRAQDAQFIRGQERRSPAADEDRVECPYKAIDAPRHIPFELGEKVTTARLAIDE